MLPCPKTQEHQSTCVDSWVHRVPEREHQPLGRGNSLWRSACPILWSNPIVKRCFKEIAPCVLPCLETHEHQSTCVDSWVHRVPENGHQPLGRGNSLWRSACPILWSNPIVKRHFAENAPSVLPCPKTKEHQSTCVDSWVHRVPDAAIHYGVQLAQYCDQTRWFNAISRRSPPVYSLALTLRNTKVPVLTHESIGYPKMDISHSDAAIHFGVQLAQYCDQTLSCYAISPRSPPLCSLALRLGNTKVPVWTHESIGYPKMDISHWDAAIHYGIQLAQYCDQTRFLTRFHGDRPYVLPCPKTQEHQSTCVDSWVHRVPENGHQPLGRGNSLWR